MVFEKGDKWLCSYFFFGCLIQDFFNIARSIFVHFPSSFFSIRFVCVREVLSYSSIHETTAWKKSCIILSSRSDTLSTAIHAFSWRIMTSLSVDEILLLRYVNLSTNFRRLPFRVEIAPSWLNTCIPFCLRSRGGQCFLLFAPCYATRIWLR